MQWCLLPDETFTAGGSDGHRPAGLSPGETDWVGHRIETGEWLVCVRDARAVPPDVTTLTPTETATAFETAAAVVDHLPSEGWTASLTPFTDRGVTEDA